MKLATLMCISVCAAALSACSGTTETANVAAPRVAHRVSIAAPVVVTKLVDTRPPEWKSAHEPVRSKMFGVLVGYYFGFGWERVDGPEVVGDDATSITFVGKSGSVPEQVDAFTQAVVAETIGKAPAHAETSVDLADVDAAAVAAAGSSAVVIIPVLDQLDVVRMRSDRVLIGGGSSTSQSGNTVTTTTVSGSVASFKSTDAFANVRIRFIVVTVAGGKVTKRSVVYASTSADTMRASLERAGAVLSEGLAATLAGS